MSRRVGRWETKTSVTVIQQKQQISHLVWESLFFKLCEGSGNPKNKFSSKHNPRVSGKLATREGRPFRSLFTRENKRLSSLLPCFHSIFFLSFLTLCFFVCCPITDQEIFFYKNPRATLKGFHVFFEKFQNFWKIFLQNGNPRLRPPNQLTPECRLVSLLPIYITKGSLLVDCQGTLPSGM